MGLTPEMSMPSDESVIENGRAAWGRVRSGSSLNDWILIGHALLVGRRLCMARANVDKPRGVKYVRIMGQWLTENGFREITSSSRKTAASCAENEGEVRAWLETLPEARRLRLNHAAAVWYSYTGHRKKHSEPGGCRTRKPIDQKQFLAAVEAVREELKKLGGDTRDAAQLTVAAVRALGLSCPAPFLRSVSVRRTIDNTEYKISLPRLKCLEDPVAA
jgi:hypothetical protein